MGRKSITSKGWNELYMLLSRLSRKGAHQLQSVINNRSIFYTYVIRYSVRLFCRLMNSDVNALILFPFHGDEKGSVFHFPKPNVRYT